MKKPKAVRRYQIRFTQEDERILYALAKKTGGDWASVIRSAIRKLAEQEGLK